MKRFETYTCDYEIVKPEGFSLEVIAEKLKSGRPTLNDLVYLKNDFELSSKLPVQEVLKSINIVQSQGQFVVYKEKFDGLPLPVYLVGKNISITEFLEIAVRLTKMMGELHAHNILIKELAIENVLINEETGEIKLCCLGSASQIGRETVDQNLEISYRGSLWHIAPEQTGRIGRTVDHRTDFYALGVILYELLTGEKPFEKGNSLEIIHAHIAVSPVPPNERKPNVPEVINNIVLKLLSKNAEDRYQSEKGLLDDLDRCIEEFRKTQNIESFDLGQSDFSHTFYISEKLYGRQKEIESLRNAWSKIKHEACHLYLVAGFSGIGKTRLISEIRRPIVEGRGLFTSGKFDQLNKETALSAFSQAIKGIVKGVLADSQEELQVWKEVIADNTDDDLVYLCELIPELRLLVDRELELIDLGPVEGKKKLDKAVIDFLSVFEIRNRPVALFLDDLQWADIDSLDLIKTIINSGIKNILVIGAYRDNEVDKFHPLRALEKDLLSTAPDRVEQLFLKNLLKADVNQFIADTLRASVNETHDLTEVVMKKTGGNPFFMKQFLQELVNQDIIKFDRDTSKWQWSIDEVNKLEISEYVVDLILKRMKMLDDSSAKVVSLAACIGNTFDYNTLLAISEMTETDLSEALWNLITKEFITSIGQWQKQHTDDLWESMSHVEKENYQFRFQHDRIQQAAYSLIAVEDREQQHYKIGNLLRKGYSEDSSADAIFDILNHSIIGSKYIKSKDEKGALSELSLVAAKKAYRNNVIRQATTYFQFGMSMLESGLTNELFKDLLIGRSECEYLLGNYDLSEELFDQAVSNATSQYDKADILCRKMALYENTQRHALAIEAAREALGLLEIELPEVTGQHVIEELTAVKGLLSEKTVDELYHNKKMDSPQIRLAMKILMNLFGPAYLLAKQELLGFKILRMVNYSIRFGNSIESALAYALYGFVSTAQLQEYESGCQFAEMGMKLNREFGDKTLRAKVFVIGEGCASYWGRPYVSILPGLSEAFHTGIESNDIIWAGYAATHKTRAHICAGEKLESVRDQLKSYIQFVRKVNASVSLQQMLTWTRFVYDLLDIEPDPEVFKELTDESDHLGHLNHLNDSINLQLPLANYYSAKAIYYYLLNDFKESLRYAKLADPLMASVVGLAEWPEQLIFKSLAILKLQIEGVSIGEEDIENLESNLLLMEKWADSCEANFKSKLLLAKAERANYEKDRDLAKKLYQEAIDALPNDQLTHISAIIHERFGEFYRSVGKEEMAGKMFRKAIFDFHEYGAKKKVDQLQQKVHYGDEKGPAGDSLSSKNLDLQTILMASQTLSGEVRIDKLMDKLLLILIKNAGAQNAYLIRHQKDQFVVEASRHIEDVDDVQVHARPMSEFPEIARGIVRQAFQTREVQIINDVTAQKDLYPEHFGQSKAESVLSLPIINKGELLALIYLDNHVSKHVFTDKRLQLLELLSGQIAISLENAELYQNLEDRVKQRTRVIEEQKLELETAKKQSDDLLLNILPEEIAEELKQNGSCKTRHYNSVTIMFTDFEDFTNLSEELSPEELIEMVDEQYKAFDTITAKYDIEKIKTIGDSYMCVSGLPVEDKAHAEKAVKAALEMSEFVDKYNEKRKKVGLPYSEMRIGLHTGPVIAGVVGHRKFAYDIWGDSVNTASRMESSSETGRVNISETTYELIKDKFKCEYRGKIMAKRKGEIDMYYVG